MCRAGAEAGLDSVREGGNVCRRDSTLRREAGAVRVKGEGSREVKRDGKMEQGCTEEGKGRK